MPLFSRIPQEVVDNILDEVRNPRDLSATSLACRCMKDRSQRNLFASIDLNSTRRVLKLHQVISKKSPVAQRLARFVRKLSLSLAFDYDLELMEQLKRNQTDIFALVGSVLTVCTRLESLAVVKSLFFLVFCIRKLCAVIMVGLKVVHFDIRRDVQAGPGIKLGHLATSIPLLNKASPEIREIVLDNMCPHVASPTVMARGLPPCPKVTKLIVRVDATRRQHIYAETCLNVGAQLGTMFPAVGDLTVRLTELE